MSKLPLLAKRTRKLKIPRGLPSGVPDKLWVNLRYTTTITVDPGVGQSAAHIFRANDMRDPDYSGTGNQPRFYDEWMAMYNHFCVERSSIKLSASSLADSSAALAVVGIDVRSGASIPSGPDDYIEGRHTRSAQLGFASGGKPVANVSNTCDLANWFGVGSAIERSDLTGGASSPTEEVFYHVFVSPMYSSDPNAVAMRVTIDYSAILYEPTNPTQS